MLYCLAQNRMQQFKGANKGKKIAHILIQFLHRIHIWASKQSRKLTDIATISFNFKNDLFKPWGRWQK